MATYTSDDARTQVYRNLKDTGDVVDEQLLTDTEIDSYIVLAVAEYSVLVPLVTVEDAVADGTNVTAFPAGYDPEFSVLLSIEAPAGNNPPELIDPRYYIVYQSPSGYEVRWLTGAPSSGVSVRLAYTTPRAFGATANLTTIPDRDFGAVTALATSIGAETIASKYARTHEPILSADVVASFPNRVEDWQRIARNWRAIWTRHSTYLGQTSGRINWDGSLSMGRDYLTHPRRGR